MSDINVYHCSCSQVALATRQDLKTTTARKLDKALITTDVLEQTMRLETPVVLRLEDGFEKIYIRSCARCGSTLGYHLDKSQYGSSIGIHEDILYIIPGTVVTTNEMTTAR